MALFFPPWNYSIYNTLSNSFLFKELLIIIEPTITNADMKIQFVPKGSDFKWKPQRKYGDKEFISNLIKDKQNN